MVDTEASSERLDKNAYQCVLSELEARENDLAIAAHLGQSLLEANEVLRQENAQILESFRQQIYELENERNLLRVRLDSVELDYDNQIKELQTDIVSMRLCVQKQRHMYQQLENEKAAAVNDLTQQNQCLSRKLQEISENEARLKDELKSIRTQCAQRKTSIQDHFHVLDSLRVEITSLREEKTQLEAKLSAITEERDTLLISLADSRWIQDEQNATIKSQDVAIANLQARANNLQEDIKSLTKRQKENSETLATATNAQPHRSLLAELAEQRLELLNGAKFDFPNGGLPGDDDDEVEMDDDALLAYLKACSNEGLMEKSLLEPSNELPQQDSKDALISELRDELGEIFQQMHQMCVEVQALNNAQTIANRETLPRGGTHTPDELAIVEMDFRLTSLKSVLADLRGLLRELVMDTNSELTTGQCTNQLQTSGEDQFSSNINADCPSRKLAQLDISDETPYSEEHKAMIAERNTLASEVAAAHRQLTSLQDQSSIECNKLDKPFGSNFVANWQELDDDDDYEFELPR